MTRDARLLSMIRLCRKCRPTPKGKVCMMDSDAWTLSDEEKKGARKVRFFSHTQIEALIHRARLDKDEKAIMAFLPATHDYLIHPEGQISGILVPEKHNFNAWEFVNTALCASDLMQSYVDKATDEVEKLSSVERQAALRELAGRKLKGPEEIAAATILREMLK